MKLFSISSIRGKLLILVLAAILPILAVVLWGGFERRTQELARARYETLFIVKNLAARQDAITAGTKQMLAALAQVPDVQKMNVAACNPLFREIYRQNPVYALIGAVTPTGDLFATSSLFLPERINLADRKHIRDAIRTLDFSASGYLFGRANRIPVVSFAYPVLDREQRLRAIVFAGIRLERYGDLFADVRLPPGYLMEIADYRGVRLFCLPEKKQFAAGTAIPPEIVRRISGPKEEGIFEATGTDGAQWIVAFRQLRLRPSTAPYLYMVTAVDKKTVLARADYLLWRNLFFAFAALGLALVVVWRLGDYLIANPLQRIAGTARTLGNGDLAARTGLPASSGELGALAHAFDEMASGMERQVTEQRTVEETYRNLVSNSPIGVYVVQDGRFVLVNDRFCESSGFGRAELLGRDPLSLVHPEDREWARQNAVLMLQGRHQNPYEFKMFNKVGKIVWSMETVAPIIFQGRPAVLGNFMDITRQKLTEEALKESEERYRTIIADIADGYYEVDLTGRFTFFNDRVWQMLRYTREETMGMDFRRYTDDAQARKVFEAFHQVYQTGVPFHGLEWEIIRKDGSRGFGEASVSLMKDAEGKPAGFRGIIRETTERKQMEDMIRGMAYEDALTRLPNRRAFLERLAQEISRAGRHGQKFIIVMMDLDRFKEVNDTLGHPTGDRLLGAVAKRLQDLLRKEDTPARMGGDEFMLMIPDVREKQDGDRIGAKILAAFEAPFLIDPHTIRITTSIGLASYPDDGADEDTLIRHVDIALYRAKDKGRNTWAWRRDSGPEPGEESR